MSRLDLFGRFRRKPRLVASLDQTVIWSDLKDRRETVTFMLFEAESGKRSYKVHQYGYCELYDIADKYLGPVKVWASGGPLPSGAKPVGATDPRGPGLRLVAGGRP